MTVLSVTVNYRTADLTIDCLRSLRDEGQPIFGIWSSQAKPTRRPHYE